MFGQRLRLARKKAGLSMRNLAGRLSSPVSAQAISKYEAGRMMPSAAVLVDISTTLNVSLDFLMGGQVEALEAIEFRRHSATSAKDRARAEAVVTEALENYLAIEDILELEPPGDPFADVRCDQVASFDEVEEKAVELREHWNLGVDPIPSVTGLLEAHGIKVIEADLPARFDGLACGVKRSGNRPATEVVVISRRTNVERRRLTLAHELAHRVIRDTGNPAVKVEKAMQRFAGAFLAPAAHLRAHVGTPRQGVTYRELMRLKRFYGGSERGVSAAAMLIRLRDVGILPAAAIEYAFRTYARPSAAAMLIRLRDVGILPAAAIEYAFRTYARPWRTSEPEPIAGDAFEKPSRFERLVWRALGEELISPVRAGQLLERSLTAVEREIRGPRGR